MSSLSQLARSYESLHGGRNLEIRRFLKFLHGGGSQTAASSGPGHLSGGMWRRWWGSGGGNETGGGGSKKDTPPLTIEPPVKKVDDPAARNARQQRLAKQYAELLKLQAKANDLSVDDASTGATVDSIVFDDNIFGAILRDVIYEVLEDYRNSNKSAKELQAFFNSQVAAMEKDLLESVRNTPGASDQLALTGGARLIPLGQSRPIHIDDSDSDNDSDSDEPAPSQDAQPMIAKPVSCLIELVIAGSGIPLDRMVCQAQTTWGDVYRRAKEVGSTDQTYEIELIDPKNPEHHYPTDDTLVGFFNGEVAVLRKTSKHMAEWRQLVNRYPNKMIYMAYSEPLGREIGREPGPKPTALQLLLAAKTDPNLTTPGNTETALVGVLQHPQYADVKVIEQLLNAKADPNQKASDQSPLEVAFAHDNLAGVDLLLNAKADLTQSMALQYATNITYTDTTIKIIRRLSEELRKRHQPESWKNWFHRKLTLTGGSMYRRNPAQQASVERLVQELAQAKPGCFVKHKDVFDKYVQDRSVPIPHDARSVKAVLDTLSSKAHGHVYTESLGKCINWIYITVQSDPELAAKAAEGLTYRDPRERDMPVPRLPVKPQLEYDWKNESFVGYQKKE